MELHIKDEMFAVGAVAVLLTVVVPAASMSGRDLYSQSLKRLSGYLHQTLGEGEADRLVIPFELTPEMLRAVQNATKYTRDPAERRRAVLELIVDRGKLAVVYDPRASRAAKEVYEQRVGNCLSITNLFVGMARAASLNARYVHVTEIDRYSETLASLRNGTIVHSSHVCAGIDEGSSLILVDFAPGPTRQYHSYDVIDDVTAMAHFYNNLAYEIGFYSTALDPAMREAREIELYQTALKIKPDFSPAYNNLGALYRRRGDVARALELYEQALEIDPDFAEAYSNRASIYYTQGKPEEAIAELKRALAASEENPFISYDLGQIFYSLGRYRDAEEQFRKAAGRGETAGFYVGLARARIALGKTKEAADSLRRALEIDPNSTEAKNLLAALRVDQ